MIHNGCDALKGQGEAKGPEGWLISYRSNPGIFVLGTSTPPTKEGLESHLYKLLLITDHSFTECIFSN